MVTVPLRLQESIPQVITSLEFGSGMSQVLHPEVELWGSYWHENSDLLSGFIHWWPTRLLRGGTLLEEAGHWGGASEGFIFSLAPSSLPHLCFLISHWVSLLLFLSMTIVRFQNQAGISPSTPERTKPPIYSWQGRSTPPCQSQEITAYTIT